MVQLISGWIILTHTLILGNHDAKRLYDDLLRKRNYNKLIRPVGNSTEKLVIKLGMKLTQIIDVVSRIFHTSYKTATSFHQNSFIVKIFACSSKRGCSVKISTQ